MFFGNMKHIYINPVNDDATHYAVDIGDCREQRCILVQLGDAGGQQIRIALSRADALQFSKQLSTIASICRDALPYMA